MITDQRIQKYIWDIAHKLRQAYQPERIILFGSYAYGQPHADSDIDMLIIKNTDERRIERMVRAQEIAFDWQRDVPFEPIVYTPQETQQGLDAGDPLLREIFEKGEVLMSASESLNPSDWFRKGDDDLRVAELLLRENEPLGIAAMLIQQGTEKYLKGYLLRKCFENIRPRP
jgi:predicted nucleotidyltransferase